MRKEQAGASFYPGRVMRKETPVWIRAAQELVRLGYFFCGILGTLFAFQKAFPVCINESKLIVLLAAVSFLGWTSFPRRRYRMIFCYIPFLLWLFYFRGILLKQGKIWINGIGEQIEKCFGFGFTPMQTGTDSTDVTLLAGTLLMLEMILLLHLVRNRRKMLPAFLLTGLPVLAGILLESPPDAKTLLFLLLFLVGTKAAGSLAAGTAAVLVFLGVQVLTAGQKEAMMEKANAWGRSVFLTVTEDWLEDVPGSGSVGKTVSWQDDGRINRGAQSRRSSQVRLLVKSRVKPVETVYLKGFTGDKYTGERWEEAEILSWETEVEKEVYYSLLYEALEESTGESAAVSVTVYNALQDGKQYSPYYSLRQEELAEGIVYSCYPGQTEKELQQKLPEGLLSEPGTLFEKDLEVPSQELPGLTELCIRNPQTEKEKITEFIQRELASRASYTLSPGDIPGDQDPVEYFLFEGKEGYCIHFASAAVLMYRTYGVPARYVTGYAAEPGMFRQQEDGTWQAELTDREAHAWPEIYDTKLGWKSVEVTPGVGALDSQAGTATGQQEEKKPEDTGQADPPQKEPEAQKENPPEADDQKKDSKETDGSQTDGQRGQEKKGPSGKKDGSDSGLSGWIVVLVKVVEVLALCCCLAAVCVLLISYRRKYILKKQSVENAEVSYMRMLKAVQALGFMEGFEGQEPDFARKLSKEVPGISTEEAGQLVETVMRSVYGAEAPSADEGKRARILCRRVIQSAVSTKGFWKRFWFRFGKVYF